MVFFFRGCCSNVIKSVVESTVDLSNISISNINISKIDISNIDISNNIFERALEVQTDISNNAQHIFHLKDTFLHVTQEPISIQTDVSNMVSDIKKNPALITPFHIEEAQNNRSNPFISAPEGGILNEDWCKTDASNMVSDIKKNHALIQSEVSNIISVIKDKIIKESESVAT